MTSFTQLPRVDNAHPAELSFARAMGYLTELFALTMPRVTIIAFWIFSDLVGDAYDSVVFPIIGFILVPWTTITYAIMWGMSSDGVFGSEWVVVGFAVLADLATWLAARALKP